MHLAPITAGTVDYKLDMSTMLAIHLALRRDLEQARADRGQAGRQPGQAAPGGAGLGAVQDVPSGAPPAGRPGAVARAARGGGRKPRSGGAGGRAGGGASVIEPLLAAIDAAAADPDDGHQRFGDIIDELISKLSGHLTHEETDGLALIDASLTPDEWQHFAAVNADLDPARRVELHALAAQRGGPQTLDADPRQVPAAAAHRLSASSGRPPTPPATCRPQASCKGPCRCTTEGRTCRHDVTARPGPPRPAAAGSASPC